MSQQTVAIIGYGSAGVNCAIALRSAGFEGKIIAFSRGGDIPYSPILTSYYAAGAKTFDECHPWTAEELASLNVEVKQNCPVEGIDLEAHLVRTAQGDFSYDKCLISTGSDPALVGFPKVEGYSPITLRSMEDARRLKDVVDNPDCTRMLVSGASMVALKTLEACLAGGMQVTLVGMNPHILDFNALPEAASRFEEGLRNMGVTLKLGTTMSEVKLLESEIPGVPRLEVSFANGDVDVFNEISVSHGMRSNIAFIPEGALEGFRSLTVDPFMRTSNPDVYAAGDVAANVELISGQNRVVGIWKNAVLQGACAGTVMAAELAGREVPQSAALQGSISTNTINVGDLLFISAGTIEVGEGRHVELRDTEDMMVVYVWEGSRLVGFNVVCENPEFHSVAYDTGAMLTLRIEKACRA